MLLDEYGAICLLLEIGGPMITTSLAVYRGEVKNVKEFVFTIGRGVQYGLGLIFLGFVLCVFRAPYSLLNKERFEKGNEIAMRDKEIARLNKIISGEKIRKEDFKFDMTATPIPENKLQLIVTLENNSRKSVSDYYIALNTPGCKVGRLDPFERGWQAQDEKERIAFFSNGEMKIQPYAGSTYPALKLECAEPPGKSVRVEARLLVVGGEPFEYIVRAPIKIKSP